MYRVLIVEDDPQVASIHSLYLEQAGFSVAGIAGDMKQALEALNQVPVQLILLDIYLPGGSGLQLLRKIRTEERQIEVIMVSAAKDGAQIREAFRLGCLDYIMKPFTYERLRDGLEKFQIRYQILNKDTLSQREVDLLAEHQHETIAQPCLPKGIDRQTLKLVCTAILEEKAPFGVQDVAEQIQLSRVSAKKYLDFLCEQKLLQQTYVYGNKGRPANLYQLAAGADLRERMEQWGNP